MGQGLQEINHKIAAQLKLLELAEKKTERLIIRNKRTEITRIYAFSARCIIGRRSNGKPRRVLNCYRRENDMF